QGGGEPDLGERLPRDHPAPAGPRPREADVPAQRPRRATDRCRRPRGEGGTRVGPAVGIGISRLAPSRFGTVLVFTVASGRRLSPLPPVTHESPAHSRRAVLRVPRRGRPG